MYKNKGKFILFEKLDCIIVIINDDIIFMGEDGNIDEMFEFVYNLVLIL
jgi:hypothetical protein